MKKTSWKIIKYTKLKKQINTSIYKNKRLAEKKN